MEDIHWQRYANRYKIFRMPGGFRPVDSPAIIVCIPAFAEPDLITTLVSLSQCEPADTRAHVFVLFNQDQRMADQELEIHHQSWQQCKDWIKHSTFPHISFDLLFLEPFPELKWGVGWARKILFDEAARILPQDGIMLCLDGDCTVDPAYLKVVYRYFQEHPECQAASIYYEHPLMDHDVHQRDAIITYELHLRYLEWAKRWSGHPFAGHTVGSSMAVRRSAYLQQGGMNTRQAGEDFYFLQKFMEIDGLHLIQDTTVYPSARISGKVPFGTGRAMGSIMLNEMQWKTSAFDAFRWIKPLFTQLPLLHEIVQRSEAVNLPGQVASQLNLTGALVEYLEKIDFVATCKSIAGETATQSAFSKRFFRHFNAFWMIRYLHYMRDHHVPDMPVAYAATALAEEMGWLQDSAGSERSLLELYRRKDRTLT